jgi:hypothetical protein
MSMKGYPNIGEALDTRILEQRARLEFHYPKEDIIVFLPFYENPVISESKTANLVEYNPLGRAGSMFAYTGAKSRKIKLTMYYTLPHLMRFNMGVEKFRRLISADSKEVQKGLFTSVGSVAPLIESSMAYEMDKYYSRLLLDNEGHSFGGPLAHLGEILAGREISLLEPLGPTERQKAIDTLVFFTNVIRTSVDNAATNPFFGPPIIRVVYGSMYQSVPCICKSYNISYEDKEAGYDLETLTPRRMKISLDLAEIRIGNFGKFSKGTVIERDNLAGWESVINNPLTTDPGKLE